MGSINADKKKIGFSNIDKLVLNYFFLTNQ